MPQNCLQVSLTVRQLWFIMFSKHNVNRDKFSHIECSQMECDSRCKHILTYFITCNINFSMIIFLSNKSFNVSFPRRKVPCSWYNHIYCFMHSQNITITRTCWAYGPLVFLIRNLEPNWQYSSCSCSSSSYSEIVTKSLPPPQNLCRPLKTFACVSLRYRKCCKIEKLSDWNTNWCGSRYWPHDYDSGDKKTKNTKKTKKYKKHKKTKKTKKDKKDKMTKILKRQKR